ncbi:MAG: sulfite exporter TauE/SafE family protein [Methyloligellaceae bacterium]
MWTIETVAIVGGAFLFGGFAKGVTGLGLPIVVLTILATTVGLQEAMGLLIVPGVITNIWQALAGPDFWRILRRLWPVFVTSVIGIWLGVQVLASSDQKLLIALLGFILFLYSAISLISPQVRPPGAKTEKWLTPVMGTLGGFIFGLTGSYMIPGVLYIQSLGMSRDMFVQVLGMIFCVIMFALGVFMSTAKLMPMETGLLSTASLVPTVCGMLLGQHLRHRMPDDIFRRVLFAALVIAGLYMMVRGVI